MSDPGHDRIAIVVVTHTGPSAALASCLASIDAALAAHPDHPLVSEVIVVDNGVGENVSPDAYGPGHPTILATDNTGFGAAANAGIRLARRNASPDTLRAVAVLNDDVSVTPGWLPPLVAALDSPTSPGAVQPKLLASSDPAVVGSMGVTLDEFGAGSDIGRGESDQSQRHDLHPIEIFTGGAVLLSLDFLDATSGFDERYFLYYEDVDLALRGAELGFTYACEPASKVVHAGGVSTAALGDELRRLQDRNRLWVAFRFGSAATILRSFWLSIRRLRHAPRAAHRRALLGGLAALPGIVVARLRRPKQAVR